MTPQTSANAALEWLRFKAQIHDGKGRVIRYRSFRDALEAYNGRNDHSAQAEAVPHKAWYAATIFGMIMHTQTRKK